MVKKRHITMIIITLIFTPFLVNSLMLFSTPVTRGSVGDWISFYGSFIGAVIGGLVAFFIARVQIEQQKEIERTNRFIYQLPTLVQIEIELDRVTMFLTQLHDIAKEQSTPAGLPFDSLVLANFDKVPTIDKLHWDSLEKIIDVSLLEMIIKFKEYYLTTVEILTFDINKVGSQINNIDMKLKKLEGAYVKSDAVNQEIVDLVTQKLPLLNTYNLYMESKKKLWSDLSSSEVMVLPSDLKQGLSELITKIDSTLK